MTAAMARSSGETLRGLLLTVLAGRDEPMTTSEVRRRLAEQFNVYVMGETLYRSLGILQRRGHVIKREVSGRRATWMLRTDGVTPDPPAAAGAAFRPVRSSTDCVKLVSLDGTLLHMNVRGCRTLGLPDTETEFGMPWLELLPSAIRDAGTIALRTAADGTATHFIGKTLNPVGEITFWQNSLTPVPGEDGRVEQILCISKDVTDTLAADPDAVHGSDPEPSRRSRRRRHHGGRPVAELAGSFQQRLNALFAGIQAPDRGPYTNREVVTALAARGVHISGPYLSQLRAGLRERPSEPISQAIAEFFGVEPVYLAAEYQPEDLPYLRQLVGDLEWAVLAHDPEVRRLTTAILELGESGREQLLNHLDTLDTQTDRGDAEAN